MATRPKSFKLGHHNVVIKWIKEADWPATEDDAGGLFLNGAMEIHLRDDGHVESQMRETLTHEIMHALHYYVGLTHHIRTRKKKDQEEYTVALLSPILLAVMRDNPRLVAYLTGV